MNKIILNYKTTAPECERRGVLVWYVQDQEGLLRSKPNEENSGEVGLGGVEPAGGGDPRDSWIGGWRRQSSSRAPGHGCGSLVL